MNLNRIKSYFGLWFHGLFKKSSFILLSNSFWSSSVDSEPIKIDLNFNVSKCLTSVKYWDMRLVEISATNFFSKIPSGFSGSSFILNQHLFFSISFYNTEVPWISLAIGDFIVKILMSMLMLIPFRMLLKKTIPSDVQLSVRLY